MRSSQATAASGQVSLPDLQKMVDEKKLAFTPAVEISFIRPKNQRYIAVSIEGQQSSPSLSQAQKMRELDKDGKLNSDVIDGILSQEKKEVDGDVTKLDGRDLPPVHIITFGSPCQNLSQIGNRKGLAGEKSSLFF